MRSYPFPDEMRGFRPTNNTRFFFNSFIQIAYEFVVEWDGLGGFGESGPDSPSLNGHGRRGRKPRKGGFWDPPPCFENRGGKKKGQKKFTTDVGRPPVILWHR